MAGFAVNAAGQTPVPPVARSEPPLAVALRREKTSPTIGDPDAPVGLGGFCPVALKVRGAWEPGDPNVAAIFDERSYYFSGERERAIFAADPDSYVPVLGGDCIVTYAKTGERVPGRLDEGVAYMDRTFLFASAEARATFKAAPKSYADADLYKQGVCPVTLVAKGVGTPGDPATTTVFANGLRFRFVDDASRRAFLSRPELFIDPSQVSAPNDGIGFVAQRETEAQRKIDVEALARSNADAAMKKDAPAAGIAATLAQAGKKKSADGAATKKKEGVAKFGASDPLLNGYCPVTIWERKVDMWVRGQYAQRWEFEGLVFLPAGRSEREKLEADPGAYIPALGGDCVVTYIDTGKRVRGSVRFTVQIPESHRLYLFADAEALAKFKAHRDDYIDADVAFDGFCVVTRRDAGQAKPGNPRITAWFEGERYLFVNEAQREKFLAEPEKYSAPIATNAPAEPAK